MSWRLFIGEIKQKRRYFRVPSSYVFTPNREEVINSRFRVRYSTTCDTYYRDWSDSISLDSNNVIPGWERGIFALDSVYRNVDEDYGEVYFDRIKESTTGNLKWKFDFSGCGLLVDEITLCLNYVEEYGGEITTTIVGDAGKKRVKYIKGGEYMTFNQLHNSSVITVVVHFIGDVHQITKLFPQKIMGGIGYPMDILISLKAPLESLGKPRILLGLMYSNSQEMQVDARHYKETGKGEAGRGFLHVDFYQGKDLPQQKGKIFESLAKCYLLPNCKKAKCKSGFKKGKNPLWDEQFLIVGVGYLEVKKQGLEICFVNNNQKKKNKCFGGLRLSLGYSKIMAAQAEKTSNYISHLFSKPLKIDNDDNTSKDQKSNGSEYKTVARFAIAVEKKEKNALHEAQINGSASAEDRDLVNTPIVNPDVNTKKTWKMTSNEELQRLDMISYKHSNEGLSLSDGDVKLRGNGIMTVGSYNISQVIPSHGGSSNKEFTPVNILQPEYTTIRKPSLDGELWTKQKDQTSSRDKIMRRNSEIQEPGIRQNQEIRKENGLGANGNNTKLRFLQSNGNVNQRRTFENQNEMPGTEDIRNFKSEQKQDVNARTMSNSDCSKAIVKNAETSGCSASLAQRWNRTATERQIQKEQKREATRNHLEKALGDELENMMLDAAGLEIKQWENMINKPKQWHYCWQILRKDMIPVHNCCT